MNELVSIVIPVYNAELYIKDTIISVLNQTHTNWELLVVNDGSTDKTKEILEQFDDSRITVFHQNNRGVSDARNNGMSESKGEFIVFLDADDIISNNFIEKRLMTLLSNEKAGFCCGEVLHFNNDINNFLDKKIGVFENIEEIVLLYNINFDTVPSNYMIRKSILQKNNIMFNNKLSSTADRLFILELNKITEGTYVENSPLYYRVHNNSMSNKLTKRLVEDNILYYKILKEKDLIPQYLKKEVEIIHAYILGTACFKVGKIDFVQWYIKGVFTNSLRFFKIIFKKLQN